MHKFSNKTKPEFFQYPDNQLSKTTNAWLYDVGSCITTRDNDVETISCSSELVDEVVHLDTLLLLSSLWVSRTGSAGDWCALQEALYKCIDTIQYNRIQYTIHMGDGTRSAML